MSNTIGTAGRMTPAAGMGADGRQDASDGRHDGGGMVGYDRRIASCSGLTMTRCPPGVIPLDVDGAS
jgi:hypothetical protein